MTTKHLPTYVSVSLNEVVYNGLVDPSLGTDLSKQMADHFRDRTKPGPYYMYNFNRLPLDLFYRLIDCIEQYGKNPNPHHEKRDPLLRDKVRYQLGTIQSLYPDLIGKK